MSRLHSPTLLSLFAAALTACGGATTELRYTDDPVALDATAAPAPAAPAPLTPLPGSDLRAWFADYDDGADLAYLQATGRTVRGGDPLVRQVAHRYIQNVPYGPYERNRLDLWLPLNVTGPLPVLVYIHGGGFVGGERSLVRRNGRLASALAHGVAVVSISYRFAYEDGALAIAQGIPNDEGSINDENGARLDYILRDCARAIQFIRYRAARYGIDPSRVGAFGESAGAGCAVWTATAPDLADPTHRDPVLRQSTRLQAVGHDFGQVTYDFVRWPQLLGLDAQWLFDLNQLEDERLLQMSRDDQRNTTEGQALRRALDYYERLSSDDPPLYTVNMNPDLDESDLPNGDPMIVKHHVRGHYALYDRCVAVGASRCEIETIDRSSDYPGDIVDFLAEILRR